MSKCDTDGSLTAAKDYLEFKFIPYIEKKENASSYVAASAYVLSGLLVLLLCSHSPNDVPPEPQRNVSIAAVRGAVRPSSGACWWHSRTYHFKHISYSLYQKNGLVFRAKDKRRYVK